MKNMKNLMRTNLLLLLVTLVLVSCSDKVNEQEGQLNAGDLDYTATENMIDPLVGAYNIFASRGWEEPLLLSVRGDDVNAGGEGDQQPFSDTDDYIYDQGYWMYNSIFALHYADIVGLNTAIELIESYRSFAPESEYARADQYIAEIKIMRAWLHYNLAHNWGQVFIINTTEPDMEYVNGVVSYDDMMQYISDQMDEAIPALPEIRPNQRQDIPGGFTVYTAYMMKALANQELENYQAVADATGEIINSGLFSLYPDFYNLFKDDGELSDESIMELQYSDFDTPPPPSNDNAFTHLTAPFGPTSWSPVNSDASPGWGFYEPSMKFIKFMLDRGEVDRLNTSVLFTPAGIAAIMAEPGYESLPSWVSNTTDYGDVINDSPRADFFSGKHYLPSTQLTEDRNGYGTGKNFIVMRYAETLLVYAEALTHGASGNGMTADQAVNMVRDRVGMSPVSGVSTDDVMDEKYAELGMEWGIRFYDMVRLGNYDELSYDGRNFSAGKVYLPYPQTQLDALPLPSN